MKYKVKVNTPAYFKVNGPDGITLEGAGAIHAGTVVTLLACGPDEVPTRLAPYRVEGREEIKEPYWINKNDVELMEGYTEGVREEE